MLRILRLVEETGRDLPFPLQCMHLAGKNDVRGGR